MAENNAFRLQMMPTQPRGNQLLRAIPTRPGKPGVIQNCFTVAFNNHRQPLAYIKHMYRPVTVAMGLPKWEQQEKNCRTTGSRKGAPAA